MIAPNTISGEGYVGDNSSPKPSDGLMMPSAPRGAADRLDTRCPVSILLTSVSCGNASLIETLVAHSVSVSWSLPWAMAAPITRESARGERARSS
jgi:hypothetical protein